MKIMKWIARYTFFVLLLAACIVFSVYCFGVAAEISDQIDEVSFIEMASESVEDAGKLLERRDLFNDLAVSGIVAGVIVLLVIALLVVYQIKEKKIIEFFADLTQKNKETKKTKQTPQASVPLVSDSEPKGVTDGEPIDRNVKEPEVKVPSEEAFVAVETEQKTEAEAPTFCDQCGTPFEAGQKFCFNCGVKLQK
ncbi:MAG: zinc ribbon domain-containing protein [Ruminococcaceae bacterium]|nr:zinc ribbon domain-containing protein [Oscillospiraceae bacterium]